MEFEREREREREVIKMNSLVECLQRVCKQFRVKFARSGHLMCNLSPYQLHLPHLQNVQQ